MSAFEVKRTSPALQGAIIPRHITRITLPV